VHKPRLLLGTALALSLAATAWWPWPRFTDLTYAVEYSTNLGIWATAGVTHELVYPNGITDTGRAKFPAASAPDCFFRLRVIQP
jgi:hypothetical protein